MDTTLLFAIVQAYEHGGGIYSNQTTFISSLVKIGQVKIGQIVQRLKWQHTYSTVITSMQQNKLKIRLASTDSTDSLR
jgi:hypothetical protein